MRGLGPFLKNAWRLAIPYFKSEERWSARLLLASIIVLNLSMVGMTVVLNFWNRAIYNSLQDKNWGDFFALLFWFKGMMPGFCEIAVVYIAVAVYRTYLNQWLQIRWRRWMTIHFLDDWMSQRAYYRISLGGPGTDNPDQRISEDLRNFIGDSSVGSGGASGVLQLGLDLLSNVVTLFSFLSILWSLSGATKFFGVEIPGYMVWVALVYSAVGSWLVHLIGRPLIGLNFRQQKVEADFRFALVRLRENVEGVALYGGEDGEKQVLTQRFYAVIGNWWGIMQRTKALNAFVAGFGQIANVFPLVVASPRYFAGDLTLGALFQTLDAFGQVQGAMSWFVGAYSSLATWRATVDRLSGFEAAIRAAHRTTTEGVLATTDSKGAYRLDDVTLALPDGTELLDKADLSLSQGQSVLISGRSGSGKSTLFRAMAGIWPFGGGKVHRPSGSTLFLPQRPYIPLGTLRHAIAYPAATDAYDDASMRNALDQVGLAYLQPRLDEEENWTQALSGGEQQRVAIARALLAKPDWLFLDEATANLDPEAETAVYETLRRVLPGTTIISIAHRPEIAAMLDRHVVFDRAHDGPGRLQDATA